jgi:hypothetical protein
MTPTSRQKTFYPHLATVVDTRLSLVHAELYTVGGLTSSQDSLSSVPVERINILRAVIPQH